MERSDKKCEHLKTYVSEIAMLEFIKDNNLIDINEYEKLKNKIENNEMKLRGEHSNILLTSFKGKNNSSNILLNKIQTYKYIDKLELTNSFTTSEKELMKYLNDNYRYVISFGQKPSTDEVFIELVANKNNNLLQTNFPYKQLETILNNNKINLSISNDAGTYLCNNIYYEGLNYIKQNNLNTKMIFVHIPSTNDSFDLNQLAHVISEFIDLI